MKCQCLTFIVTYRIKNSVRASRITFDVTSSKEILKCFRSFKNLKVVGIMSIFRKKVQIKSVSLKYLRIGLVKYLKYDRTNLKFVATAAHTLILALIVLSVLSHFIKELLYDLLIFLCV